MHCVTRVSLFGTVLASSLAFAPAAHAATVAGWVRLSQVTDSVTDNLDGTWTYEFTVHNDSRGWDYLIDDGADLVETEPYIIDWELPYFSDSGITSVQSPDGWEWSIEDIGTPDGLWGGVADWQDPADPFYFGATSPFTTGTQVLHWYTSSDSVPGTMIEIGESLGGFSFVASYGPGSAPYQASWFQLPVRTGDPAFPFGGVPASPMARGPVVPLPTSAAIGLAGLGLGAVLRLLRRRR